MPFTLAHPAAVLPLRGLRYLRTAPLIIGALVPDLPYFVPGVRGHPVTDTHGLLPETHRFEGSFTTDLALGYACLAAVFILREPLTALLSPRARWLCLGALSPFTRTREWVLAPVAIVLGVWTHLLWDAFTHNDGWMVHRVEALSAPVTIGAYTTQVCHVLQYLSSVFGLIVMVVWYWRLPAPPRAVAEPGAARSTVTPVLILAAVAALLIGSVQAVEQFNRLPSFYLTINVLLTHSLAWFGALYLIAGIIFTLEHAHERVSG